MSSTIDTRNHSEEKVLQNGGVPYSTGRRSCEGPGVIVTLSGESLDAIVDEVRARLVVELERQSPWMTRALAAEYLGVPVSRLEKDHRVPCHRWEGRVMYHRGELDEYLLGFGSAR
jgi:hypothetical protein